MNKLQQQDFGWKWDHSYTTLPDIMYSPQQPTKVLHPQIAIINEHLAQDLGLELSLLEADSGAELLSGNHVTSDMQPIAQAYAGHQFGHFTMLGDGRAILLGEHITPRGERVDIQLKGAGRTPYSRGGDGRAALGPMLREYIISEALYSLGIPTTRSLAVVETGEFVQREHKLPGAILTRVAASHLRVGTFQYAANWGGSEVLSELVEYALNRHYQNAKREGESSGLSLLKSVITNQAKLIAQWQLVGFIHGVMNTDNMTISGQAIDFGPCAFMNRFEPDTVFSSIDYHGRYSYQNQPQIAGWNLARFAEALLPILDEDSTKALKIAQEAISSYGTQFEKYWLEGMRRKLGIVGEEDQDQPLIQDLLSMMQQMKSDFTNTFIALTTAEYTNITVVRHENWEAWLKRWETRRMAQDITIEQSQQIMAQNNPFIIPRNHVVEEVIAKAEVEGDYDPLLRYVEMLRYPYQHSHETNFCTPPTEQEDNSYVTYCGT